MDAQDTAAAGGPAPVAAGHAAAAPAGDGGDGGAGGAEGMVAYDPAAPAPLGVARGTTGNAEVDARLERLSDVDHLTADGHIEVYEDVHRGLRETLSALDARPGPPAHPASPYDIRS
ncbi:hypothetical protein ACIQM4_31465 [Streptomyces sp. NPDC091272]|uniref:hypothetical protein n=1 Tax=Streptomyces sp. NPDC091272 TaxID=3365981 RepID=UPI0038259120